MKLREVIPVREDDPHAKKTALGWGVIGVVNPVKIEDNGHCSCHCIASLEVNPSNGKRMCHFTLKTKVKEIFQPLEVIKMFETDFHEANKDGQALSHDDRKFIKKTKEGIHCRDLGTLVRLKIPRCYKPVNFRSVKSVELHNFSYTSTSGYG